jgi:glycosyltransferase involved in cell wall biosynthesis
MASRDRQDRTVAVAFHEPVVGGAEVAMLRVLRRLEDRGWRFVFWAPGPGPLQEELESRGYDVTHGPRHVRYSWEALRVPPGPAVRLASIPGYLRRFRRWAQERSPAFVQANTLVTIPEALAVSRTNLPVLMYVHEILPPGVRGAVAARLIRASVDVVMTNTKACIMSLAKRGVPADHHAMYGIELPDTVPDRRRRDGPVVVGTLGTVSRRKGSDVFLAAARLVRQQLPDVEFRMIGPEPGGSEQPWAEDILRQADAAGIRHGRVPDQFAELAEFDLFVLPTRREAFGLVIIEAMATGLPVVASSIDGPREIVTPDTGVLVEPDDPHALAAEIIALVQDPGRRVRMGAAGRERVERNFTLDAQADALHRAYLDASSRRG